MGEIICDVTVTWPRSASTALTLAITAPHKSVSNTDTLYVGCIKMGTSSLVQICPFTVATTQRSKMRRCNPTGCIWKSTQTYFPRITWSPVPCLKSSEHFWLSSWIQSISWIPGEESLWCTKPLPNQIRTYHKSRAQKHLICLCNSTTNRSRCCYLESNLFFLVAFQSPVCTQFDLQAQPQNIPPKVLKHLFF